MDNADKNILKRILITPGEPAGIGPDILIQAMQFEWPFELIAIADPELLLTRAQQLNLPFSFEIADLSKEPKTSSKSHIKIHPCKLPERVVAGKLNKENAAYVIDTLTVAAHLCLTDPKNTALVTGPVNKAIINQSNIPFTGHTEWLAKAANVNKTVMLFIVNQLKIALLTTHLPLKEVASAIDETALSQNLRILNANLIKHFDILNPKIAVCGLNPHAGENGYLGREEIDVIAPTINNLKKEGLNVTGPYPADTIFTQDLLPQFDAVLAMYHDQALPLVKYLGFGQAVNVTLGLPFIRTSVDHGTALDIAGTGKANAGSLIQALQLAALMLK